MATVRIKDKAALVIGDVTESTTFGVVDKDGLGVRTVLPALLRQMAAGAVVEDVAGTTYTILLADRGKILRFTNAAGCAVTVPDDTLPAGWRCWLVQGAAGQVTIAPAGALALDAIAEYASPLATRELGALVQLDALAIGAGTSVVRVGGELDRAADYVDQIGAAAATHAASHLPAGSDPLATAAPPLWVIGASNNEGSDESFARSDHVHGVAAPATPQSVGVANNAGTGTAAAREDHVHAGMALDVTVETVSTDTYTLTLADRNKLLLFTHASGCTVTCPDDTLPIGWSCALVQRDADSPVVLAAGGSAVFVALAQYVAPPETAEVGALITVTVIVEASPTEYKVLGELALA